MICSGFLTCGNPPEGSKPEEHPGRRHAWSAAEEHGHGVPVRRQLLVSQTVSDRRPQLAVARPHRSIMNSYNRTTVNRGRATTVNDWETHWIAGCLQLIYTCQLRGMRNCRFHNYNRRTWKATSALLWNMVGTQPSVAWRRTPFRGCMSTTVNTWAHAGSSGCPAAGSMTSTPRR